jgi:hypothetical protein
MPVLDMDRFETDLSDWSSTFGSPTINTGTGVGGTNSVRFQTKRSRITRLFTANQASVTVVASYCPREAPASDEAPGIFFRNSGNLEMQWKLNTDLTLSFRRGNSTIVATSTATLTLGSYVRTEFRVFSSNTVGTAVLYIDGVSVLTFSGDTLNTGTPDGVGLGHLNSVLLPVEAAASIHDFDNYAVISSITDGDPFNDLDEDDTPPPSAVGRQSLDSGLIYEMGMEIYDDDGCAIRRVRRTPPISSDQLLQFFSRLQVDHEAGVGLNGNDQGSDPKFMVRWSDDGGKTWSNEYLLSMGKIGQFANRAVRHRMGSSRNRVFEVSTSDPVKVAMLNGLIDYEVSKQ